MTLSAEYRQQIADGSFFKTFNFTDNYLYCACDVWSIATGPEGAEKAKKHVLQPWDDSCFYFPYSPKMSCPTAKELERRAANRREAEKDRKLTRRAFWVAFTALVVSILATLANLLWNIWTHFHPFKP